MNFYEYKKSNANRFFDTLTRKSDALPDDLEDESKLQLDSFKIQSFIDELPTFLQFLANAKSLDDENLTMSLNAFNNFAQFSPKETVANIIIDSGALDCLVKYGSNDIANIISNPIFRQNILLVFNVFGEMSKSIDFGIIFKMIQKGVLSLCINNYHILDDFLNKTISFILHKFISSSFYSRGLVYSTGILYTFIEKASEFNGDFPFLLNQFISGIAEIFVASGPTIGSPIPKIFENQRQPEDQCAQFWDDFTDNYYYDTVFNKELFQDFIKNGIEFIKQKPIYTICENILPLPDDISVLNCLKTIYILVSRDCHTDSYEICQDLCSGGLCFLDGCSKFLESKNREIIEYTFRIISRAFYPNNIKSPKATANDVAEVIINFLIKSDLKYVENLIAYASHALTNILETIKSFDFIYDKCDSFFLFIFKALRGSFKVRKAVLYFYMTVAVHHINQEIVIQSIKENMPEIISITSEVSDIELRLKVVKSLYYILEVEDNNKDESKPIYDLFQKFGGFDLIMSFIDDDDSDKDLVALSESFKDAFYGDIIFS